ncbi:hypothetical protein [Pelagerythrobacter sp.]|uniref:hypothetical protein n=1 Tax=Pelagerythrobacter sp. TaxID=2800702 RepID=UPI0035B3B472
MHISTWASALALAATATAAPLAARAQESVRDRDPGVMDVAKTPLTDLNLSRDAIPELLLAAAAAPYASEGLTGCGEIGGAIAELDVVLGPDLDVAEGHRDDISVGRMAKSWVGSFIPFRSIVREVTGAADHQRDFEAAIVAGLIRRGYLKGLGAQMGCSYPARPAFARIAMPSADPVEWRGDGRGLALRPPPAQPAQAATPTPAKADQPVVFVSHEVVQGDDDGR